MAGSMQANIQMIESPAMVYLPGRMEGSMKVSGLMATNMEEVYTQIKNKFLKLGNGVKVKGLKGQMNLYNNENKK